MAEVAVDMVRAVLDAAWAHVGGVLVDIDCLADPSLVATRLSLLRVGARSCGSHRAITTWPIHLRRDRGVRVARVG